MAAIVNARDVQLQSASARLLGLQLGPNVEVPPTNIPGLEDAINGKSVVLTSTSQVVQEMNDGSFNPTSITVVAQIRGLTNTPTFEIVPGSGTMSVVPALTDGSFTFTGDELTSPAVTLRLTVVQDGNTYSDEMSFVKVKEGADGIAAILTNENFTFPADSAGNVSSYVGASGNFKVYQGTTDVTSVCTFAIVDNPDSLGVTITASGTNAGLYAVNSGFSSGLSQTTVTFRATFGTLTVDKTLSLSKAKAGVGGTGLSNAIVYIYQRAASTPALPSADVTYTFATKALTGLTNGWQATIPAGTQPLYATTATASSTGASDTIASNEWASAQILAQNGTDGVQGGYTASLYIYKRATSTPAKPTATTTYTFDTQTLTGLDNGWTTTIPAGTDPIFVSTATAFSLTTSDTIAPSEWATPVILAQNGSAGVRGSRNYYVAVAATSYSDILATATASADGGPIVFDQVVQYNNAANFSQTKYWNGTGWTLINSVVDGNLLVTGSVGASKMLVSAGTGNNLWIDPSYMDVNAWAPTGNAWGSNIVQAVVSDGKAGQYVMRGGPGGGHVRGSRRIPVTVGKQYRVSMWARKSSTADGTLFLRLDADNVISGAYNQVANGGAENSAGSTTWTQYSSVWIATYPYVSPMVILNYAGTTGYFEAQDIRIEELTDSALIVQGGITADRIDTRNLLVRDAAGNVILGAGYTLPIGYAPAGTLNSNVTSQSLGIRNFKVFCTGGNGVHPQYGGGSSAVVDVDNNVAVGFSNERRSYVVQEFDQNNFSLVFQQTYDVFGNGEIPSPDGIHRNAAYMAADLNWICDNRRGNYIVVRSYDEPSGNRMSSGLPAAMYRCGASQTKFGSPTFSYRSAYILIGRAGIGEGGGVEQLSKVGDAAGAWAELAMTWSKGILTVSGAGAPRSIQDFGYTGDMNATYGATFGQNISGQMNAGNISTYIAGAAINLALINTASIGNLSALSATIGMLRTTNTGARVEISDNLIQVFYSNGQTAVRISS